MQSVSDELLGWASRSAGTPDSRATFTSPCRVPEPLLSLPTTWTRMGLSEELWHHQYWLPPGATWEDMKESADTHYPKPQDLWLCLPGALLLIVVRCIFERWVAQIQLLLCLLSAVSVQGCSALTLTHLLSTEKLERVCSQKYRISLCFVAISICLAAMCHLSFLYLYPHLDQV